MHLHLYIYIYYFICMNVCVHKQTNIYIYIYLYVRTPLGAQKNIMLKRSILDKIGFSTCRCTDARTNMLDTTLFKSGFMRKPLKTYLFLLKI